MRAFGAVAAGAVAAACAAAALAGPPSAGDVRDCRTRAETGRPVGPGALSRGIRLGPLVLWRSIPGPAAPTSDRRWRFRVKAPVFLVARGKAVLAIPGQASSLAAFRGVRQPRYVSVVRFEGCRDQEPAWTYPGRVGRITAFPLAIGLARRSLCLPVDVWIEGRPEPIRRVVPVGRRSC